MNGLRSVRFVGRGWSCRDRCAGCGSKTCEQQRLTERGEAESVRCKRELRVGKDLIDGLCCEGVVGHRGQHRASAGECGALVLEVKVGVNLRGVGFAEKRLGIVGRIDVARRGLDDSRPRLAERAELGQIDERVSVEVFGMTRLAVCGCTGDGDLECGDLGVGPVGDLGARRLERLHRVGVSGLRRKLRLGCGRVGSARKRARYRWQWRRRR